MQAIVKLEAASGLVCQEVDRPLPKDNEVLIKVEATAICGTDISFYNWNQSAQDFASKFAVTFPFVLGHECSGTVVEIGSQVKGIQVGDRVALETHIPCGECFQCREGNAHNCMNMSIYGISCDGCFGEYATAPESVVFKLDDAVSFEEGALFEAGGVAMRAVEEADVQPGETALVFGCGAIGLMAVQILQASGAANVIAVDIDPYRVNMAKEIGAIAVNSLEEDVHKVVQKYTSYRGGVDIILEMTGSPKVYETMFDMLRLEGKVVTVGHPGGQVPINITKSVNLKGARIKGVFGRRIWGTWHRLGGLVVSGKVDLLKVATHRFPFNKVDEAFAQIKAGAGKIIFLPGLNQEN